MGQGWRWVAETLWEAGASGQTFVPNKGVVPPRSIGSAFPQHNIHQNCSFKDVLVSAQPLVERRGGSDGGGLKNAITGSVSRVVSGARKWQIRAWCGRTSASLGCRWWWQALRLPRGKQRPLLAAEGLGEIEEPASKDRLDSQVGLAK